MQDFEQMVLAAITPETMASLIKGALENEDFILALEHKAQNAITERICSIVDDSDALYDVINTSISDVLADALPIALKNIFKQGE